MQVPFASRLLEAIVPVPVLIGHAMRRGGAVRTGIGAALIGIGRMLISLSLLEHATSPIRGSEPLAAFLSMLGDAGPIALVLAAGLAVLGSSSLAAVVLVRSLPPPPPSRWSWSSEPIWGEAWPPSSQH